MSRYHTPHWPECTNCEAHCVSQKAQKSNVILNISLHLSLFNEKVMLMYDKREMSVRPLSTQRERAVLCLKHWQRPQVGCIQQQPSSHSLCSEQFNSSLLSSALQTTHSYYQNKSVIGFQSSDTTAMNRAGQQMMLLKSAVFYIF